MEDIVNNLNENKFFIGLMMICVTIGGRFIITELNEEQKKIIHNKIFRRLIIFSAFFMSTRDIFTAIILTIIFTIVISELFNGEDNMQFFMLIVHNINKKRSQTSWTSTTIRRLSI